MIRPVILGVVSSIGCQNPIPRPPVNHWPAFPFEEGRTWDYENTNISVSFTLRAERTAEVVEGSPTLYTIAYREVCRDTASGCEDHERLRLRWSSAIVSEVQIHTAVVNGQEIGFEPPLAIATSGMRPGDQARTESNVGGLTSTYLGTEPCDVEFERGPADCNHYELEPDAALPLGLTEIRAAPGRGPVVLRFRDDPGPWRLSDLDCGTCDGSW